KLKDLAAGETLVRGNYEASALGSDVEGTRPAAPTLPLPSPKPAHGPEPARDDVDALQARVEADPASVDAAMELAAYYRRRDDFDHAHAVLRDALGATGNAFAVTVELADLEVEPFRRNLAITEEKLTRDPENDDLRRMRLRLRKEINTRELE